MFVSNERPQQPHEMHLHSFSSCSILLHFHNIIIWIFCPTHDISWSSLVVYAVSDSVQSFDGAAHLLPQLHISNHIYLPSRNGHSKPHIHRCRRPPPLVRLGDRDRVKQKSTHLRTAIIIANYNSYGARLLHWKCLNCSSSVGWWFVESVAVASSFGGVGDVMRDRRW